jgi:hypothetical protein
VLTASRSAPGEPFDPEAALHGAAVEVRSAPGAPWKEALAASSAPLRAKLAPDRALAAAAAAAAVSGALRRLGEATPEAPEEEDGPESRVWGEVRRAGGGEDVALAAAAAHLEAFFA